MASELPRSRSSLPAMRGPRSGVKPKANQLRYWSDCILGKARIAAEITHAVARLSSRLPLTPLTVEWGDVGSFVIDPFNSGLAE
jgi:hypothetical protein